MQNRFQILCVTTQQTDFSKLHEMNIHSNVVFANQAESVEYKEYIFDGKKAQMITTNTRGVGINRNISLMYASAEICLLADDDMYYTDDLEQTVVEEFDAHPDADIIIFNVETAEGENRKQKVYTKTKRCGPLTRMPWGGVRIAFRLASVKKANLFFTTLFGGGCIFASGEDSLWLKDAKAKGLTFYVSERFIGKVSFDGSSWFTGRDEKFFYARGAYIQAQYKHMQFVWALYYAWRLKKNASLSFSDRLRWIKYGRAGFEKCLSYDMFVKQKSASA